jgi:hypothetical protein
MSDRPVRDLSIREATQLAKEIYEFDPDKCKTAPNLAYHILTRDEDNPLAIYIMMNVIDEIAHGPLSIGLGEYVRTLDLDVLMKDRFAALRRKRLILFDILEDPEGDMLQVFEDNWPLNKKLLDDLLAEALGPTKD